MQARRGAAYAGAMGRRPKQAEGESADGDRVEAFIQRWQGREGGQERANYALFLSELCGALGLDPPDPADASTERNDYVFERIVREVGRDGTASHRRIDLYRRGAFVLEAKQSRQRKGGEKEVPGQEDLFKADDRHRGRRGVHRAWDVLMMNARQQAEDYVRLLPADHAPPPFVIVCDVGHCFEVYANFRRDGKAYDQFPDRQSFRVYLDDLRRPEIRERLSTIWRNPLSLDPALSTARVTRQIAERLAAVSKALESGAKHPLQEVAMFLMRCLFTMFAEDVGLLPEKSFKKVLERCESEPDKLGPMVGQLWEAMDKGGFAYAIEANVRRFNGEFFKSRTVLPLGREEIGELRQAATYDWRDVDPSIFGTLLEQALDPAERQRLGAHYTPRAYVERLVIATVIEPLRDDWRKVLSTAERHKAAKRDRDAIATVRAFHQSLCDVRILDPACGTGNFLYVALELVKRLEGEVLEALLDLGGEEALVGLSGHTVDPHQFLGLELNTRAAAIAELVLWIGHLQWHARTKGGLPSEPILKAFRNIEVKNAVLSAEKALARGPNGKPLTRPGPDGTPREVYEYRSPQRPDWPQADFIVGNPPFIGGKDLRSRLGDAETEALWAAHPHMNDSADFVMYWWDHAASLLTRKGTRLRRFGLVTTNSISQVFQRRVMERYLKAKRPISLVMAIPDHPWSKASPDAAAVRIAMTVAEAGVRDGDLREVVREAELDTDTPTIELSDRRGHIHSDLSVGVDVTAAAPLLANEGICSPGVKLHGAGFILKPAEAEHLGLGKRVGLNKHIRPYRNGRDLTARPREALVIDLFGMTADEVRASYPEVYQHLLAAVKPARESEARRSRTKDAEAYAQEWWLFGKPRPELRPALNGIPRYVVTVETMRHRVFQFLDGSILADNKLIVVASEDPFVLGVLSSRIHVTWATRAGGWLGAGNDSVYVKSRCFDPFPFPVTSERSKSTVRSVAEEIDALRKQVLSEHPELTLTGLYNILDDLRRGVAPDALDPDRRHILDAGLVLVLKELHERLDAAVAAAYGWPADLTEDDILARVVDLNRARAKEEAEGVVRWLRPDYQAARFAKDTRGVKLDLAGVHGALGDAARGKPGFPTEDVAQTAVVMAALADAPGPLDATAIASRFRQGKRVEPAITATLAAIARMGFISSPAAGRYVLTRGGN